MHNNLSSDRNAMAGTWMPKTWGLSGDRLILNAELEFTTSQLYEREEFLGGMGGAKVLHLVNNEMTLAPSLRDGLRTISVKNGGWRIARGDGPMGTDLLRFYIEVDEEISRKGGDTFCPKGRIYCNCGYFPLLRPPSGYKDRSRKQLDDLIQRADSLHEEIESDTSFFSIAKVRRSADLFKLQNEMQRAAERYAKACVVDPERSILSMSPDQNVGLTKEGGVCCKVVKGMAAEYHILGRFSIKSSR